jgi:hypothetical protein
MVPRIKMGAPLQKRIRPLDSSGLRRNALEAVQDSVASAVEQRELPLIEVLCISAWQVRFKSPGADGFKGR